MLQTKFAVLISWGATVNEKNPAPLTLYNKYQR